LTSFFSPHIFLKIAVHGCIGKSEVEDIREQEKGVAQPRLARVLGLREGFAIQMGMIIGSGIFIVPATIAGRLQSTGPVLTVWIFGGILVLFGALTLAELSSLLPEAGGSYVYIRHSFGRLWAYLFSWNHFFINTAGTVAAISVAFATYLGYFIPALSPQESIIIFSFSVVGYPLEFAFGWIQIVAIMTIAVVTAVNVRGVKFGGWVMNVFTAAKVGALIALVIAVWLSTKGRVSNFAPWWPSSWTRELTGSFGLCLVSVLWAYDGWTTITLAAGEFKNPGRDLPRSLLFGTVSVILLYIAANLAYISIIPLGAMAGSARIAADVARVALGPGGASLIIAGILCSTFGTINGSVLGGPRCLYAAGADGTFPKRFGRVHPRFKTPSTAILTLGTWSAVLTLSGTYDQIITYVVFGSWAFYGLGALSVIVLRRKMPHATRPYKAWGYPYATLAFVAVAGWFIYNTLVHDSRNAIIGISLLLVSLPFYFYWTRDKSR
jgi:APA family basic amino acid/polyamine antiporter